MTANTSESALEALIEASLLGGPGGAGAAEESPTYGSDGGGYLMGSRSNGWNLVSGE